MIKSVHLKNYILIDDISVDFSDGLNVITGETGSGKSILINAIDIAFGAKVSGSLIKTGKEKAVIEVFISSDKSGVHQLLKDNDIDESDEIVVSREITETSSRIRVNGTIVNQSTIKDLKALVLDIHSQHQTYAFLQPKTHITLLDNYSKDEYGEILEKYRELYSDYLSLQKTLAEAQKAADFTESQIDFLQFQIKEIEDAGIETTEEDEQLQNELKILENSEKLKELTYGTYWAISGDDGNLSDMLSQIKLNISKAARMDSSLEETEASVLDIIENVKDLSASLRDYSQSVSDDTERLNEIQERLFLLNKLKRKYGGTLENVLETYSALSKELNEIEFSTQILEDTKLKIKKVLEELTKTAEIITAKRKSKAKNLSQLIMKELDKLELPKSKFEIRIEPAELNANGADSVEFFITTNVSQGLAPLAKTASGGELSRVMLAIKTIFAQADDIDTVIFDEIDTGISGKAAQSVADEIHGLSEFRQILLITHQAIIASKADLHLLVSKEQNKETQVDIKTLNEKERISAIANMASGKETESSVDFAKSLLKNR